MTGNFYKDADIHFECMYTLQILKGDPRTPIPLGVLTLKRDMGMSGVKDPLFTLPHPLHKTSFLAFVSSTRPHFKQKTQNLPKFGKFSVSKLKNWPKI